MQSPPTFAGLKPQTSPLSGDILFPCQFGPAAPYSFSQSSKVTAGTTVPVSFLGSAVHGGGSCQLSLSKTASLNPGDWKVIHTIIGGCPATIDDTDGNLEPLGETPNGYSLAKNCDIASSTETNCLKTFDIFVPPEIPSGDYFFAWTWVRSILFQSRINMLTSLSSTKLAIGRCI